MDRPYATADRATALAARRTAQTRAAHAAARARRAAAARRRGVLAGALLLLTVVGTLVAALSAVVPWPAGAVPGALLGGVLVLGRRAVVAGRAAEAAWQLRLAGAAAEPLGAPGDEGVPARRDGRGATVVGRAVHPSQADTEVFAPVRGEGQRAEGRPAEGVERPRRTGSTAVRSGDELGTAAASSTGARSVPDGEDVTSAAVGPVAGGESVVGGRLVDPGAAPASAGGADAWQPVPVPRPTYTQKAAAPRREPKPLTDAVPAVAATSGASADASGAGAGAVVEAEPAARTTGGIDLDAVLARRRASGL